MTYDAIRVPWRIAIDSLWFDEPRAQEYLDMVLPTVLQKSGVDDVKMYEIPSGNPIEWHNELSVAMWAAGASGSTISSSQKQALVDELRSYYNPQDQSFNAQWAPAKWYYFNQALSIIGAATIDGSLANPIAEQSGGNENGNQNGGTQENQQGTVESGHHKKWVMKQQGRIWHNRIQVVVRKKGNDYVVRFFQKIHHQKRLFYRERFDRNGMKLKKITFTKKNIRLNFPHYFYKQYRVTHQLKVYPK